MVPSAYVLLLLLQIGPSDTREAGEVAAPGLPAGPVWGRDTLPPEDANAVFATSDGCAHCHGGRQMVSAHIPDAIPAVL